LAMGQTSSRWRNWVPSSMAVKEYELTFDQIEYGIFLGLIKFRNMGNMGKLLYREDIEKNLSFLKSLPSRIWFYKTEVMRKYRLTKNQIDMALEAGLVRYKVVKNPYNKRLPAVKLVIMDVEANLESIRAFPKYTESEIERRKVYAERSRLRDELEFYCPRCKRSIRPPRGSRSFEDAWSGSLTREEALEKLIIAHYRHLHTDYDSARNDVDRWVKPEEVKRFTGVYESFKEFLAFYIGEKEEMDREEREYYIAIIRQLRGIATERAKRHFSNIARKLAEEDGLLKPREENNST